MKILLKWLLPVFVFSTFAMHAEPAGKALEIYWIDVEGGGGTLIVTPAKESILIDSGWAHSSSASRIHEAATKAGVKKIDYLITTHFHVDHFGGAAELAKLMPIGTVLDNGTPAPGDNQFPENGQAYREFKAGQRRVIQPGEIIPLKQTPKTAKLNLRCMGARKQFFHPASDAKANSLCATATKQSDDPTDNANSTVLLLEFGGFKFYDGGDLTWNMEGDLVCPKNSIGTVDVFQVDHHGIEISNNPLLIQSLAPTVSVMNNGARKGGAKETLATLRGAPSIQTMYQVHRDLRGEGEFNTLDKYIANLEEKCSGNYIKCSVESSGKKYTITIPATGYTQNYQTREK